MRVRRPMPGRQRGPFVVLVLGLLGGGLVSLLLLNTVLAQDSYRARDLREEIARLQLGNSQLAQQNEHDMQPGEIARRAEEHGYKPDPSLKVLRPASEESSQVDASR